MYAAASCSNPLKRAIMPCASVISRVVGRSAIGCRRRVPTSSRCCSSVTYPPSATAVPCAATYNVHHLAVNIWGVGLSVRGRRPGRAAVALDQMPRP